MLKIPDPNDADKEIEVFTAEELAAKSAEIEGLWKPQVEKLTGDLTEAQKAATARAREFGEFRKLSDEQVTKLGAAERIIYENQLAMAEKDTKLAEADKKAYESSVDQAIRAKVGNDPKLIEKAKAMYSLIGLSDVTPEEIQARAAAAVGALTQTEPDLIASLGIGTNGTFVPPVVKKDGDKSFSDTEAGKAGAAELGLTLEPKK